MNIVLIPGVLLVVLAAGVWWLVALIEVCTAPEASWRAVGQSRVAYVLLMIFLGLIGTLIYAFGVRGRLRAAQRVASVAP